MSVKQSSVFALRKIQRYSVVADLAGDPSVCQFHRFSHVLGGSARHEFRPLVGKRENATRFQAQDRDARRCEPIELRESFPRKNTGFAEEALRDQGSTAADSGQLDPESGPFQKLDGGPPDLRLLIGGEAIVEQDDPASVGA